MTAPRQITRADILPIERYAAERREHQRRIGEVKRRRRVDVGPFCSFHFENYDTLWFQVHEMLRIERGGELQIADELEAYNPLVPNGRELSATVMFEIADPARREMALQRLGGVEDHVFLRFAGETVRGIPDPTRENTSPEGKASAVQFVKFPLSPVQKDKFSVPGTEVTVGIDHPEYRHAAALPEATRQALAEDLD
jgi:hypothetical protein